MKARIKFEKTGVMKYVGHLDTMRFFQKAMRRAQIPIKYSEGFNPHQIMSFASPLGVGVTSGGEYMDIELKEVIDPGQAMDALNGAMVEGVRILDFFYLPKDSENAMSSVKNTVSGDLPDSDIVEIERIIREHNATGPVSEMNR